MSAKRSTDASLSPLSKRGKNSPNFSWSSRSFDGEPESEEGQPSFGMDNVKTYLSSNVTTWQMIGDPNFIHDAQQYSALSFNNLGDNEQEFMRSYDNGNSLYSAVFRPEPWQSFDNEDAVLGSSTISRMDFGPSEGHGNTSFDNWDLQSPPASQGSIGSTIALSTTSFHSGISMQSREPSTSSPLNPTLQGLYERASAIPTASPSKPDTNSPNLFQDSGPSESARAPIINTTNFSVAAFPAIYHPEAKTSRARNNSQSKPSQNCNDSPVQARHAQRPPIIFSRSFDDKEASKHEISRIFKEVQWQHILTPSKESQGSKNHMSTSPESQSSGRQNFGKRKGPLKPENAKRASETRKRRACWSCWLMKIPCIIYPNEKECHRCKGSSASLFSGIICSRTQLPEYSGLFFPMALVSHLQDISINTLIRDNILEFGDDTIKVHVSSGNSYEAMELSLRRFSPRNEDFLVVHRLEENSEGRIVTVQRYASPLGLRAQDVMLLKKKCSRHIQLIVSKGQRSWDGDYCEFSDLSSKILAAIHSYWRDSTIPATGSSLRDAFVLYEIHSFMGRSLKIIDTDEPERSFGPSGETRHLPFNSEVPSSLLNRQIKSVMNVLLRETTNTVLGQLEKELRTKSKRTWASSFCTILLLCICVEELQVALDGYAVHCHSQPEKPNPLSRDNALALARQLDDRLIGDCKALFHSIHKTHKVAHRLKNEKSFNPIRDPFIVDNKEPWTKELYDLVEDVHEILGTYGPEITERAEPPRFSDADDLLQSHMEFRKRNSGRLVAKFLRSFLDASD